MGIISTLMTSVSSILIYRQTLKLNNKIGILNRVNELYKNTDFRKNNFPILQESEELIKKFKDKNIKIDDCSTNLKYLIRRAQEKIKEHQKINKL